MFSTKFIVDIVFLVFQCVKVGLSPSKETALFAWFKALQNDEECFCFILKVLFVLKIFKFLSWLFGHVEKPAWLEREGYFQSSWRHKLVNKQF